MRIEHSPREVEMLRSLGLRVKEDGDVVKSRTVPVGQQLGGLIRHNKEETVIAGEFIGAFRKLAKSRPINDKNPIIKHSDYEVGLIEQMFGQNKQ